MSEWNYQILDDCHGEGLLGIWADPNVIRYINMGLLLDEGIYYNIDM